MKLKTTFFAGLLAASFVVPAFANDAPVATPLPQFTAADTQMLFEQDEMPMQLAALSQQEMKETEGAFLPVLFILGSAAVSAWGYHATSYYNTGSIGSTSGAMWAAGIGGLSAAASMTRFLGPYPNTGGFGIALTRPFTSNPYKPVNQFGRIDFHKNSHDPFIHTHRGRWGW